MTDATHYIPIVTTCFALWFAPQLFRRWAERRPAPHLICWGIGVLVYAVGTTTESLTTLVGWQPAVFRLWYISGALLGGAPLAQGTAYLLLSRRTADIVTRCLVLVVVVASVGVLFSPINLGLVEAHRLSGHVLRWTWVRGFSPFINSYALIMLVGGAIVSAWRYHREGGSPEKVVGNVAIAVGGLLPGIGGTATRFGHVEVLYVTELIGLIIIYLGFSLNIGRLPLFLPAAVSEG
jgi:hypothetical protein